MASDATSEFSERSVAAGSTPDDDDACRNLLTAFDAIRIQRGSGDADDDCLISPLPSLLLGMKRSLLTAFNAVAAAATPVVPPTGAGGEPADPAPAAKWRRRKPALLKVSKRFC